MGGEEWKPGIFQGNQAAHELRLERASACGLRQGAVNAGGSQVGGLGRGVFGRPDRNSYTPAPSGYSNASLSSRANVSAVVPARFQAPSLSNRKSPMRRPHGAITRPMARKSVRSACSWSRRLTTSGATRMNARSAVADLMLYLRPFHAAPNTTDTCLK